MVTVFSGSDTERVLPVAAGLTADLYSTVKVSVGLMSGGG